jgi:hypothetical protein
MPKINNIVLVHGGFVDGAGWRGVYDILKKDGFNVSIVQTYDLAGGRCERYQVDNRFPTRPRDPGRALLRRGCHHRGGD